MEQTNLQAPRAEAAITESVGTQATVSADQATRPGAASPPKQSFAARSVFIPRTAVGLDIAHDPVSVVKIRRYGSEFKVLRAASASVEQPKPGAPPGAHRAALGTAIRQAMQSAGIKTSKVTVNLPEDSAECNVHTLPPMPPAELEAVLRRQGVELCGAGAVWDYMVLPRKGDSEHRVMAAYISGEKAADCVALLKECGLTASSVCVSHLALLPLARRLVQNDETAALVHFGRQAVSVIILANGSPSLVRRIEITRAADSTTDDYVVQEVNRTFLYYKQKCRGERVARVIQSGASESMIRMLAEATGASVDDFGSLPFSLGGASLEFSPVAAGLAVMGTTGSEINLLPEEIKQRPVKGMRAASMLVAAAVAVVIFAACYLSLCMAERMYGRALANLRSHAASFAAIRREHGEIEALKEKLDHKQRVCAKLLEERLPWPYLLWGMGRIVPPGVHLKGLSVARKPDKGSMQWQLTITGELGVQGDRRTVLLRELLDRLHRSGLFARARLEPLRETSVGEAMNFSITCEVLAPVRWAS